MTYGRSRSRRDISRRMISYCSSPKLQTSLAAPVCSEPTPVSGRRTPCSRNTGQNTPNRKPGDDQPAKRRVVDVAFLDPADVRGPPGDAGQADVQARGDLAAQVVEGRVDVTGPDQRAPALAAGPGRADQADNLGLALALHVLVEAPGVQHRVDVGRFQTRAEVVAQVLRRFGDQLGLAGVQPPGADAVVVVVLLDPGPDKVP